MACGRHIMSLTPCTITQSAGGRFRIFHQSTYAAVTNSQYPICGPLPLPDLTLESIKLHLVVDIVVIVVLDISIPFGLCGDIEYWSLLFEVLVKEETNFFSLQPCSQDFF
jgi:hypothetical protein